MAYVAFLPESGFDSRVGPDIASPAEAGRFTSLELQVIAAAEGQDVLREPSLRSPFGKFARIAFGLESPRPLANPRLEALRRFASLAAHHPERLDEGEQQALVAAGFTPGQALGLLSYFANRRDRIPQARHA